MTNPAGTRFAQKVVEYLQSQGFIYAERRAQRGSKDAGDLAGLVPWVVEIKAEKRLDAAGALSEAKRELANDPHTRWHCAILKRRNHTVGQSYVIMELETFCKVIADT